MSLQANNTEKCPHCSVVNRFEILKDRSGNKLSEAAIITPKKQLQLSFCRCTNCSDIIIILSNQMIYPLGSQRTFCSDQVPENILSDYKEACLVEPLSKKAGAALARRCLQNMLHEQGIKGRTLDNEIELAMEKLPSYLSEAIDAIRNIGNFAAHPMKSTNSGEIIDVEEGETERILDTLELLFDFYYVQPSITKQKRNALNEKLKSAGKPEMK